MPGDDGQAAQKLSVGAAGAGVKDHSPSMRAFPFRQCPRLSRAAIRSSKLKLLATDSSAATASRSDRRRQPCAARQRTVRLALASSGSSLGNKIAHFQFLKNIDDLDGDSVLRLLILRLVDGVEELCRALSQPSIFKARDKRVVGHFFQTRAVRRRRAGSKRLGKHFTRRKACDQSVGRGSRDFGIDVVDKLHDRGHADVRVVVKEKISYFRDRTARQGAAPRWPSPKWRSQ